MTATEEQTRAVAIALAIVETCRECGSNGAPGGHLYAGLLGKVTLQCFTDMMARLCRMGLLEKRGQCYHYTGTSLEPALGGPQ